VSDQTPTFSWGHININVTDLDRSIAFYEMLGFEAYVPGIPYLGLTQTMGEVEPSGVTALGLPTGAKGRACIMQLGRGYPKIDLTELDSDAQAAPLCNSDTGIVRLCLATGDLVADYERLSALGVAFLSPPQTDSRGLAQIAVCSDPDGALIELIQIDRAKWAALRE
jgi:catechol 2,3-dioxygenase-like lactoylglutathione lyase family enzyme